MFTSTNAEVVEGMNSETNTLWNSVISRCNESDTLTGCSVESHVYESGMYVSVLLTGTYTYSVEPSQTFYDGVILDKNTGNKVSAATVLSISESDIQSQIGETYQAAVVKDGKVVFYKNDGSTAEISLP